VGQIKTVNSIGDPGDSLDLVGKAVPAAEIQGLQQDGLGGGMVTCGREYIGVRNALDNLPLGSGRSADRRVNGHTEGPCVVSCVEQSAQLDLPPDEGIEERASNPRTSASLW
jgi:hypothetical protein